MLTVPGRPTPRLYIPDPELVYDMQLLVNHYGYLMTAAKGPDSLGTRIIVERAIGSILKQPFKIINVGTREEWEEQVQFLERHYAGYKKGELPAVGELVSFWKVVTD